MSIKIMSSVWGADLPHNQLIVLMALADHASDDGICWPSLSRVAWKTRYSESSVRRIIKQLEEKSIIKKSSRDGATNLYEIVASNIPTTIYQDDTPTIAMTPPPLP